MRRCLYIVLGLLAVMLSAASCGDDTFDNSIDEPLKISVDTIIVSRNKQSVSIGVTARDADWSMTGSEDWCVVSPASGDKGITQVTVSFASNDPEEIEGALPRSTLFTFTSGGSEKSVVVEQLITDINPNPNPDAGINSRIYDLLGTWYYNGEAKGAPVDYNQYYDQFYFNFLARELKRNENFEGNTWARNGDYYEERYLYSYIEKNPAGTALVADAMPRLNYGMEFDLAEYDGRLVGRILYVEPGSPAAAVGLKRGDWFHRVNGTRLGNWQTDVGDFGWHYNRFIDTLVNPREGISPTLGMLSFRAAQRALVDENVTVTLTPARHRNQPILGAHVFREERLPDNSGNFVNVGYLMYNNFDPAYMGALEDLFATVFKPGVGGQPLDAFILDLRYNKNGSVETAELMGNLLVGNREGVADKIFSKYEFDKGNPEAPARTEARFAPHEHGIGVGTVYVLTSRFTAGASELLINALRGLDQSVVKLVVVGEATQGLAAGMVKKTVAHPTDPAWEFSAWMLAFRCSNGTEGGRDYTWGLVPNGGTVDEWNARNIIWSTTWEWKGEVGSTEDPLIETAVDMIIGREFVPEGNVINDSKRARSGLPRSFCFPTNMTMDVGN